MWHVFLGLMPVHLLSLWTTTSSLLIMRVFLALQPLQQGQHLQDKYSVGVSFPPEKRQGPWWKSRTPLCSTLVPSSQAPVCWDAEAGSEQDPGGTKGCSKLAGGASSESWLIACSLGFSVMCRVSSVLMPLWNNFSKMLFCTLPSSLLHLFRKFKEVFLTHPVPLAYFSRCTWLISKVSLKAPVTESSFFVASLPFLFMFSPVLTWNTSLSRLIFLIWETRTILTLSGPRYQHSSFEGCLLVHTYLWSVPEGSVSERWTMSFQRNEKSLAFGRQWPNWAAIWELPLKSSLVDSRQVTGVKKKCLKSTAQQWS